MCNVMTSESPQKRGKWATSNDISILILILDTLQGTSPYPTKREKENQRLKSALEWDMLVPRRVVI